MRRRWFPNGAARRARPGPGCRQIFVARTREDGEWTLHRDIWNSNRPAV